MMMKKIEEEKIRFEKFFDYLKMKYISTTTQILDNRSRAGSQSLLLLFFSVVFFDPGYLGTRCLLFLCLFDMIDCDLFFFFRTGLIVFFL